MLTAAYSRHTCISAMTESNYRDNTSLKLTSTSRSTSFIVRLVKESLKETHATEGYRKLYQCYDGVKLQR